MAGKLHADCQLRIIDSFSKVRKFFICFTSKLFELLIFLTNKRYNTFLVVFYVAYKTIPLYFARCQSILILVFELVHLCDTSFVIIVGLYKYTIHLLSLFDQLFIYNQSTYEHLFQPCIAISKLLNYNAVFPFYLNYFDFKILPFSLKLFYFCSQWFNIVKLHLGGNKRSFSFIDDWICLHFCKHRWW
jgi:hypothetical protein